MNNSITGTASKVGSAVMSIIMTALIALNFFSGIIAGIWLAIIGDWGSIGLGFLFGFVMPYAFAIASLPSMGLALLLGLVAEKGSKIFTALLGFLSSAYNNILIAIWAFYVFGFFIGQIESSSYIPYLLWGYSTVMAPLAYMASKEPPDSYGTSLGLLFAQVCFLVLVILWFLGAYLQTVIIAVSCIILAFSLFAVFMALSMMSTETMVQEEEY